MPAYSEQEIISGCRKKSRVFQQHLYKLYYSMLLKVCARYAKNMQDAEQLLNDGYLKIFNYIENFKNTGSFEGWMHKIMVNTCLDYLRNNCLKQETIIHSNSIPADESNLSVTNYGIDRIEFKELVYLIQSLPTMTRTVFNLFVFEGYNHKQISEQLEITEGTSHWHLHNARTTLQKKIKNIENKNIVYETGRI